MTFVKNTLLTSLATLCVACSPLGLDAHSDAACHAQLGNPCTSIQDADGQGSSSTTLKESARDTRSGELSQPLLMTGKSGSLAVGAPDGGAPYHVQSYRMPERLATAWLSPRLDADGIFHEATFVHFVVQEASWGRRGL